MASPVKLAPAMGVVWVNAWVSVETPFTRPPFQAEIVPFRLAKMKAAGAPFPPLLTLKPIPIALATCPVGPAAPAGGTLTVNKGFCPGETPGLPVTAKRGAGCWPLCEIQIGPPFANETPQGFFSM